MSLDSDRAILIRYDEIALKKAKRGWFEQRLGLNISKTLQRELGENRKIQIKREKGRLIVETSWNAKTANGLSHTFGLTSFSPVLSVPTDFKKIESAAIGLFEESIQKTGLPQTFRVRTRRSDKALPMKSADIDREIGSQIKEKYPELIVNLKAPDLSLGIEVRNHQSFVWTENTPGPGGLPVGCNGSVLSLISGGLDSPVASIHTLKRGSPTDFIYFDGTPFVDESVLAKVEDLVSIISRYSPFTSRLIVVPFGKIQEKIALVTNPRMRTLLYRRLMIRVACRVAEKTGAQALVTGEALGQVASQTLENLRVTDSVSHLPILRPLIGMDKSEIVAAARKWGTYETSIRPGVDCCTLFADRHPIIHGSIESAEKEETLFDVDALVEEALSLSHRKKFN